MDISVLHCVVCEDRHDIHMDDPEDRTVRCPRCGEKLTEDLSDWGGVDKKRDPYRKKTLAQCKLLRRLWAGPHSITYRGKHRGQDMPVLFEIWPHDGPGYDEDWMLRLLRGVAEASKLRHPNVVVIYNLGRREGFDFCMRELVDGGSVRRWIEKRGAVRLNEALPLLEDGLRALKVAERQGMYSGRISPDTCLLDYDESLKLEYFGRPYHPQELQEFTLTPADNLTGPCYYLAPEQVENLDNGSIQSDLYSLGLTLYEMLSGKKAFDGSSADEILQLRREENPVALGTQAPDVPEEVCSFIHKLTARHPDDRPETAAQALDRFRTIAKALNERPDVKDAPAMAEQSEARGQHLRAVLWTITAFILIFLAIVPLYHMFVEESSSQEGEKTRAELAEEGRVLVIPPESTGDKVAEAFGPMAAMHVNALGPLASVDSHMLEHLMGAEGHLDRAMLKTNPSYVLRLINSEDSWSLQFRSVKGREWTLERDVTELSMGELKAALGGLFDEVSRKINASDYTLMDTPNTHAFWMRWREAHIAERQNDFEKTKHLLNDIKPAGDRLPGPVRVFRAYCQRALAWQGKNVKSSGGLELSTGQELSGEWGALKRVLQAINDDDAGEVRGLLANFLGMRPQSPRGYYLLGQWRMISDMPMQEGLAAFWQGVEADPGYLPNIHAIIRVHAENSPERLEDVLAKYADIAWHSSQVEQVEDYTARVLKND
ncbi:MAG: serine/threonine protein kinase [Planctomycetota bacterium]